MSPKKAKPAGPSFRTELKRRASDLGIGSEDFERALVIGQIAGLLVKDPGLRERSRSQRDEARLEGR